MQIDCDNVVFMSIFYLVRYTCEYKRNLEMSCYAIGYSWIWVVFEKKMISWKNKSKTEAVRMEAIIDEKINIYAPICSKKLDLKSSE